MNRKPTQADVARLAGVSKSTVGFALSDRYDIAIPEATRQKVKRAAAEIQYRANPVARALATGRTGSVALWIRSLLSPYDARVAHSFESQVESQDWELLIRPFGHVAQEATRRVPCLLDSVDGIVTHGLPPEGWLPSPRGVPLVITGSAVGPDTLDHVQIDLSDAARDATEHLLATGRRRVAFLSSPRSLDERYRAYLAVMRDAGLAPEFVDAMAERRQETRRLFREYVIARGAPEAVFCHNDDTAVAAYRALCDLKLRVPDDVALVGCDGIEDVEFLATPISTISLPFEEMSRLAWQYLKRRMAEPDAPPQRTTLRPTLVIRESSQSS